METHVDEDAIRKLGQEIAKGIKTEADLGDFSKLLKKIVVEAALDAELTDHLGYDKYNPKGNGNTFFGYPPAIRKAIYTTNAIESLNSVIRKATRQRKVFPTEKSALKVVYLASMDASKKWTMPIRN